MASEEPAAAAAAAPSPLEKPLKDLTEEDIAQLTREDCRRFLKQKGGDFLLLTKFETPHPTF